VVFAEGLLIFGADKAHPAHFAGFGRNLFEELEFLSKKRIYRWHDYYFLLV
jgi:hypothetical protein